MAATNRLPLNFHASTSEHAEQRDHRQQQLPAHLQRVCGQIVHEENTTRKR